MKNIIIAPDSYKNNLRSIEVAQAIALGLRDTLPNCQLTLIPMADGGEGTTEAVTAFSNGKLKHCQVHNPLMRQIDAQYGDIDARRAVMEMAASSGIELIGSNELNPLKTTTFGTGELLSHLINEGKREIYIGIGGSATTDGGAGFLQALGMKFFSHTGTEMPPGIAGGDLAEIASVDATFLKKLPSDLKIQVLCDVDNPLLGSNGSAAIFAPQKGATPEMVKILEGNLTHYLKIMQQNNLAGAQMPSDGAAGGLGFALQQTLKANLRNGADLLIELAGLDDKISEADLIVTGEGRTDSQSAAGKLCSRIAALAKRHGKPVVLISGALAGDHRELLQTYTAAFSTSTGAVTLSEAIATARQDLIAAGANLGALLNLTK